MSAWSRLSTRSGSLVALAVAAAAVVGVHVWLDVIPSAEPEKATVVEAVGTVELGGQELTLDDVRWDEFDAPAGSRTLSVYLDAVAGAAAANCGPLSLTEAETGRVWLDAQTELDLPGVDAERYCLLEPERYRLLAVFLLPDDASGPFTLDVPVETGEVARFRLEA